MNAVSVRWFGPLRLPLAATLLLGCGACARLDALPQMPAAPALPPGREALLDRLLAPEEAAHPGQSAFRLLARGDEAFAARVRSAQLAERGLDVQTYIWNADLTGRALAHVLLEAADRGVRVRLLVDDMSARARNPGFAALHAHPLVEVRLFNPFASRQGILSFVAEALSRFRRINRRMHNKTWIADNRVAIVGGRNLGDEYFDADADVNFADLDFIMAGPVVRDASASFDAYWHSSLAYPMDVLDAESVDQAALDALRSALDEAMQAAADSRYAAALRERDPVRTLTNEGVTAWTSDARFLADDPRKANGDDDAPGSAVATGLWAVMREAEREILAISPYFVPGREGAAALGGLTSDGRQVRILTNSLAANDVAAVHGGYARHRQALLAEGVELWEIKPTAPPESSFMGSSGASLHTKAMAIDGRWLFVGSYNMDPRSTSLNTEQGVLIDSPPLAAEFARLFGQHVSGERAWSVTLENGQLFWRDGVDTRTRDPDASFGRRFQAWAARVLRLDPQL